MRPDETYLQDIRSAGDEVLAFLGTADEALFLADSLLQAAVAYKLAIIGEAAGNLSPGFRAAHPTIPWQRVRGLRSHLIHAYGDVDQLAVWRILQHELPDLLSYIEPLIPSEPPQL
jgi:uncharacterized protein with HEPN domain